MSTTTAVFEILVIGVQTAIWIALAALVLFPETAFPCKDDFAGWETSISAGLLIVCYTLGIVMDRIVDCLYLLGLSDKLKHRSLAKWWRNTIQRLSDKDMGVSGGMKHIGVLRRLNPNALVDYLAYIRRLVRISRATVVNLILISLWAALYVAKTADPVYVPLCLSLGFVFALLTFFAHGVLDCNHARIVNTAHEEIVREDSASQSVATPPVGSQA